jgi:hypothetical protein
MITTVPAHPLPRQTADHFNYTPSWSGEQSRYAAFPDKIHAPDSP